MTGSPSGEFLHENTSCELMITTNCNMKCSYCIASDLPKLDMTNEIGSAAIDYFIHLSEGAKIIDYSFTGGEPLFNIKSLKYLVKYAVEKSNENGMGAKISIKTNGTLVDKKDFDFFKKYKCVLFVSIDGVASDHNLYRGLDGINSHNQTLETIKLLIESGINCIASMTVHPNSASHVCQGVHELVSNGIYKINVAPAYGTVDWKSSDTKKFTQSLIEVAKYTKTNISKFPEIEIGPVYKNTDHTNNYLMHCWGCNAGSSNLAFLPNGDISGCSSLAMLSAEHPNLIVGNIFTGIEQKKIINLVGNATANGSKRRKCANCYIKKNCSGGCLAINYSTNRTFFDPPMIYCESIGSIPEAWELAWCTDV